jgi:bacterioferritin
MRGNDKVIEELNKALAAELNAIAQYMVHAEMCHNWGYQRLGAHVKKQALDEMKHAEGLIERILFLEGAPQVNLALAPRIGQTVKAQIENDLAGELEAVHQYNAAVRVCVEAGDNATRELFERMVTDEERHADFLETQLSMIAGIGLDNYLAQQLHA